MSDSDIDPGIDLGSITPTSLPFYEMGTQYYISGRFAVDSVFSAISGNLMHHAVEMYLKAYLSDYMDYQALKKLNHHLPEIWKRYKQRIGDVSLDRFDEVIDGLHAFEDIRYPHGAPNEISIGWGKVDLNAGKGPMFPGHPMKRYRLSVGAIDELVQAIFTSSGANPKFLEKAVWWPDSSARNYLYMHNEDFTDPTTSP